MRALCRFSICSIASPPQRDGNISIMTFSIFLYDEKKTKFNFSSPFKFNLKAAERGVFEAREAPTRDLWNLITKCERSDHRIL